MTIGTDIRSLEEATENAHGTSNAPDGGKPLTIRELMRVLREKKEEEDDLKLIEEKFLATRKIELLGKFIIHWKPPEVKLKEIITEPCTVFDKVGFLNDAKTPEALAICQRIMRERDEDAKKINPDVVIREIEDKDVPGTMYHVYIGVEGKEFAAFNNLRNEERRVEHEIAKNQALLNEQVAAEKIPAPAGDNISYASKIRQPSLNETRYTGR